MASSSTTLRALSFLLGTLALAATAHAQAPDAARMEKARTELHKRFEAADTNKDGKLSAEEAKAGMPMVSRNFAAIDTGHNGAVSMADIQAFAQSKRGSRKAAN